jgi:rare lipoprotein A
MSGPTERVDSGRRGFLAALTLACVAAAPAMAADSARRKEIGRASWYGGSHHGHATANGERFDRTELTAAHPTLPMNSLARVTNLANGRSIVVRINDRFPRTRGRVIDLSQRAAEILGMKRRGVATVKVEAIGD